MLGTEYLRRDDNGPLMSSMSLGALDSIATTFFVMRRMRKQNTCVNRDKKNIVVIVEDSRG